MIKEQQHRSYQIV